MNKVHNLVVLILSTCIPFIVRLLLNAYLLSGLYRILLNNLQTSGIFLFLDSEGVVSCVMNWYFQMKPIQMLIYWPCNQSSHRT